LSTEPRNQGASLSDLLTAALSTSTGWIWVFLFALLCGLFWEPAMIIWRAWTKEGGYYSHGPLVPAVAAWMVYSRLPQLRSIPWKTNWWGVPILLVCSLVYLASTLCHMYPPQYFSFVFYILGLNLLLFGSRMVRATLIPWAFLFFMVPLPDGLIDVITYKLRLSVTAAAVMLTDPLDWYVVKSGNYIYFPNGDNLVVGDICAGLRSIISLLALGAVFAYLSSLSTLGSFILFLLSAPVAIITNILRIFALIVVAHYWGSGVASGKVHDLSGWAIFVVAFSLLYLCHIVLERFFSTPPIIQEGNPSP
jgi:exosortase